MTTVLVVLACLICAVLSDQIVHLEGEITHVNPIWKTFTANIQAGATITIDHTKNVRLCIRQLPVDSNFTFQNNSAYWNISCDFSFDFKPAQPTPTPVPEPTPTPTPEPVTPTPTPEPETPTPTPLPFPTPTPEPETPTPTPEPETPTPTPIPFPTPTPEPTPTEIPTPTPVPEPVPLATKRSILNLGDAVVFLQARGIQYSIAVALLEPEDVSAVVNVTVDADTCPAGQVSHNGVCEEPKLFEGRADDIELDAGEVKFYSFNPAAFTGSFKFLATSLDVTFSIRYRGNPQYLPDAHGPAPIAVDFPAIGLWYFSVTSAVKVPSFNITYISDDCSKANRTGGPGCKISYDVVTEQTEDQYKMGIAAPVAGLWQYWKVIVNKSQPLWVSARSDSGEHFPSIYASKNQLPTATSYELKNCNFDYCDGANILQLNVTSDIDEVWFVGTTTNVINNTYGVWFNSVCAQECTEQNTGTCQTSEPNYGMCVCATSSLTGVDCTVRNGLPPEYIVLIIIAALVVASAIIGFVAWAYMRRKRVQYEHVTG